MATTAVTVVGKYLRQDNSTPATGTVTFLLNEVVQCTTNGDEVMIARVPLVATLDGSGEFSIVLTATTGAGIIPASNTYHVIEEIDDVVTEYDVALPHLPTTTNLALLPRITEIQRLYQYVEYQEFSVRVQQLFDMQQYGLLSARPAATVGVGRLYLASDVNGGTLYVSDGTSWIEAAPSAEDANAGKLLTSVSLTANAAAVAISTANTPFRIPELTTPSFTVPDGPVVVESSVLAISGTGASGAATGAQLRYTKDGWATNHFLSGQYTWRGDAPFYIEATYAGIKGELPPAGVSGGAVLAPGDTVQVGLFLTRTDNTKTLTLLVDPPNSLLGYIHVVGQ